MVGLEDCEGRIVVVPSAGCRVLMLGLAGAGEETGDDEMVGSLVVVDDGDFDAEGMSAGDVGRPVEDGEGDGIVDACGFGARVNG